MKYAVIDGRMRASEKCFLKKLGYRLIELPKSTKVYPEISSHVDIFACQIKDTIFAEKSVFGKMLNELELVKPQILERRRNSEKGIPKM